jgi:hypothetical protein
MTKNAAFLALVPWNPGTEKLKKLIMIKIRVNPYDPRHPRSIKSRDAGKRGSRKL